MAAIAATSGPLVCSAALDRRSRPPMLMSSSRAVALVGSQSMGGFLRRLRLPDRSTSLRQPHHRAAAGVRAVWKQEIMWAEAPVADVGIACEEHYHLVLDISANRELMEGHTKAGQFVQVTPP